MTYFQPQLRIAPSTDGGIILFAELRVPSGHYITGEIILKAPPETVTIHETQPVQFVVRKRGGIGVGAEQTLSFSTRFARNSGKTAFAAFVMLDDLTDNGSAVRLVGRGGISIPKGAVEKAVVARKPSGASVTGASAWTDRMPPSEYGAIHTVVSATAPSGGYTYRLTEFEPLDITGKAFGLELVATPPSQAATDVITTTDVPFKRELKKSEDYDRLFLLFEGAITVYLIQDVS